MAQARRREGNMKVLKPLPHAVLDYAWAGTMMAAPWLFGFRKNRAATVNAVGSGAAILGLSLMTRYPLGAVKLVSFPTHGVIETIAGAAVAAAPWLMGFSRDDRARWTHLAGGLGTLAVVAMTDYRAQEPGGRDQGERPAAFQEGRAGQPSRASGQENSPPGEVINGPDVGAGERRVPLTSGSYNDFADRHS